MWRGLVAVDPIDHRCQGCALAGPCRPGHQDQSLRPGREALQHAGEMQLLHGEDRLRNQSQHHRWTPQGIHQVDAHAYEGKGMGAVEFLVADEGINLLR